MGKARAYLPEVDEAAIQRIGDRVVAAFHPIRVVLFGSRARGEARPGSDIDLFVEMESDRPARERRLAIRRLLDDEGYPLDVVVLTPAEVAEARREVGSILSYVDDEGRVLYERGFRSRYPGMPDEPAEEDARDAVTRSRRISDAVRQRVPPGTT